MKKSRGKNRPAAPTKEIPADFQDFGFWIKLADGILGDDRKKLDAWNVNEVATILYGIAERLREEFLGISRICDKNEEKTISVSGGFELDRRNSPPEITVRLNYAEKHGKQTKKKVPDPNDLGELPLNVEKGAKSETPDLPDGGEPSKE